MEIVKKSDVYVYIAGKYTDKTMVQTEQNILDAKKIAIECANRHIKFFCPHTHGTFWEVLAKFIVAVLYGSM